ncbi:MAG: hypothetical protein AUJ97_05300 [Bacteroidetes bacterium CG2_30_32_10]|nr:MAG: hypothetical protein AUJ97_05300 [Bacteroidetes bacterium CG2_30_32_10]
MLAAAEYERIFFISADVNIKNTALLKKSYCYKQDQQFDVAANTLKRIDFNKTTDSIYTIVAYEYALNSFLNEDYNETLLQLNDLDNKVIDSVYESKCLMLKILTLNELQKWKEATITLNNYFKINHIKVDSLVKSELLKKPKLKNEKLAKNMSYIIPGSGQIYTGHWGRGFSSLLLSGAFATYTYISFVNGFYLSGVFSGFSPFRMFWSGGANYAEYLAKQKNKERISQHNKKVKNFILKTIDLK